MVLSSFLFYFVVLLISFVMMTHVFTFFELLQRHRQEPHLRCRACSPITSS